ncbi:hypothetical protein B0I37DRAFT_228389 [Chaetomium sp. MPI-CAGE-AT-0009]|nr:hypothetical protein B0I37DRAFT_228389 [Chaetomium sp. MPI-CAGE-AT-0009]
MSKPSTVHSPQSEAFMYTIFPSCILPLPTFVNLRCLAQAFRPLLSRIPGRDVHLCLPLEKHQLLLLAVLVPKLPAQTRQRWLRTELPSRSVSVGVRVRDRRPRYICGLVRISGGLVCAVVQTEPYLPAPLPLLGASRTTASTCWSERKAPVGPSGRSVRALRPSAASSLGIRSPLVWLSAKSSILVSATQTLIGDSRSSPSRPWVKVSSSPLLSRKSRSLSTHLSFGALDRPIRQFCARHRL